MANDEPSNVTSIKQAARLRARAHRQSFLRRALPYIVILAIAGIGGVLSLRSMPVSINTPASSANPTG